MLIRLASFNPFGDIGGECGRFSLNFPELFRRRPAETPVSGSSAQLVADSERSPRPPTPNGLIAH